MKNITAVELEKYRDASAYKSVGNGVYQVAATGNFVVALSCTLQEGEDSQYPLEDILDRFYVSCTGHMEEEQLGGATVLTVEIEAPADSREDIEKVAGLVGKHVYNQKNGQTVRLVIE